MPTSLRAGLPLAKLAMTALAFVALVAGASLFIFDGIPRVSPFGYVVFSVVFGVASMLGSLLAWKLRLPRPLGALPIVAFWCVLVLIMCVVPIAAVRWGLWVFWVWSAVGSYAVAFILLSRSGQYPG